MDNIIIRELYRNSENYYSKEVQVSGWVRTVRDSKTFGFIEINDGSFFKNLQIVFDNTLNNFDDICKLTLSSSITVIGNLVKTENAKQPFEIKANKNYSKLRSRISITKEKTFNGIFKNNCSFKT